MKKFTGISGKIFAGVLALALVAGMFGPGTEVMAATDAGDEAVVEAIEPRTTTTDSFSIDKYTVYTYQLENDNSYNNVKMYVTIQPNSGSVKVGVYNNKKCTGTAIETRTIYAQESGITLSVTVPKSSIYGVKLTTTSTSIITGTVRITS